MVHFFALLFWVAGALAFVAGLPQLGVAIFVVVVLDGAFAFAQEQRSEHAAEELRNLLPRLTTVIRDGQPIQIPAESWSRETPCCSKAVIARVDRRTHQGPDDGTDPAPPRAQPPLADHRDGRRQCGYGVLPALAAPGFAVEQDGVWQARRYPMEAALDVLARRVGIDRNADVTATPDVTRFPFDTRRRRMSVVTASEVFVKDAPDTVLPGCTLPPGATDAVQLLAGRGLRVLAIVSRAVGPAAGFETAEEAERGLTLLGLAALEDPPREHAAAVIAACRQAGGVLAADTVAKAWHRRRRRH